LCHVSEVPVNTQSILDHRLLLVTGKGGVGKSTTAATLAVAAARTGRRTCLVEVEERHTMPVLFDTEQWDFTEREVRPQLFGMAVDPEASLQQYLEMFYGAKRLSKLVVHSTAVEFATATAPGITDVLLIGKVKEIERRRDADGRFHYDLVIVDAPPTGRIINFLRSPEATIELAGIGPVRQQAQSVADMLTDPNRTRAIVTTLLEEMPVTETIESVRALRDLQVAVGPLIANRVMPERFDPASAERLDGELDAQHMAARAKSAGAEVDAEGIATLQGDANAYRDRLALQQRMRSVLDEELPQPRVELFERYAEHFGPQEISALAEIVEEIVA
jgi:anion-transporting  ArsA/GET3 family ATPase